MTNCCSHRPLILQQRSLWRCLGVAGSSVVEARAHLLPRDLHAAAGADSHHPTFQNLTVTEWWELPASASRRRKQFLFTTGIAEIGSENSLSTSEQLSVCQVMHGPICMFQEIRVAAKARIRLDLELMFTFFRTGIDPHYRESDSHAFNVMEGKFTQSSPIVLEGSSPF